MSLQYLKKKTSEMKLIFCMQINIKVSCKLISTLWAVKTSYQVIPSLLMDMIKHSQSTKVKKVCSIFKISQKRTIYMEFIFCMQINIKFLQVGIISFLIEIARHIQSTQNKKLVILVQYIKKKSVAIPFVFYCDAKYSGILQGSSHVRFYMFRVALTFKITL